MFKWSLIISNKSQKKNGDSKMKNASVTLSGIITAR